MNKVQLVGRLTKDPDERNGAVKFTTAVDRKVKKDGEPTADFVNCTAFGKTGEFIGKYFRKGNRIGLSGHIQTGSYTNRDGQKVYTTGVIVEDAEFVESKNTSTQQSNSAVTSAPKAPTNTSQDFMSIDPNFETEMPFN